MSSAVVSSKCDLPLSSKSVTFRVCPFHSPPIDLPLGIVNHLFSPKTVMILKMRLSHSINKVNVLQLLPANQHADTMEIMCKATKS